MTWFDPETVAWTYASRRLIPARLLGLWTPLVILAAGGAFAADAAEIGGLWAIPVGLAVLALWGTWVVVRQVTAHAWAEREDDLIVKRGRVFRRVTVVPYGRMQYVEVSSGPLLRALGLARVQLHTASPGTDAHLAGVPREEAARIRDRLASRGEAQLAGL